MAKCKYVINTSAHSLDFNTQDEVCYQASELIWNKKWFYISMYRTGIGYSAIAEYNYLFGGLKIGDICPPQLKRRLEHMVDKYKNEGGRIYD